MGQVQPVIQWGTVGRPLPLGSGPHLSSERTRESWGRSLSLPGSHILETVTKASPLFPHTDTYTPHVCIIPAGSSELGLGARTKEATRLQANHFPMGGEAEEHGLLT